MTTAEAAELVSGANTWWCGHSHANVTWEAPAPAVGDKRRCVGGCGCRLAGMDGLSVVQAVRPGVPLALVRECLGRSAAAAVLAVGGAA